MAGILAKYVDQALEQELVAKRSILAAIESDCIQQELDLTTLKTGLEHFRERYWRLVAPLYARLDEIHSYIAAYGATSAPDDPKAKKEAEEARKRAEESAREANRKFEFEEDVFEPSDELRQIYKRAAKMVHPDRASDDKDRAVRNDLMAKINVAYGHGDLEEIERLVEAYKHKHTADLKLSADEELKQINKQIIRMKQRLVEIGNEIQTLHASELGKLKRDVDFGEDRGLDPLGDLAASLQAKIEEGLNQLEAIKRKQAPMVEPEAVEPEISAPSEEVSRNYSSTPIHPEHLIHTTDRGEKVRSKSEVIIANLLHQLGLEYFYEFPVEGTNGIRRPDFMVYDKDGKMLLWEHLGMLHDPEYKEKWERKLEWYADNGFVESENLFVTIDAPDGSFDTTLVRRVAEQLLGRL